MDTLEEKTRTFSVETHNPSYITELSLATPAEPSSTDTPQMSEPPETTKLDKGKEEEKTGSHQAMIPHDPRKSIHQISENIKYFVGAMGATKAIVSVSGGVDSAVVYMIASKTLGANNVIPVHVCTNRETSSEQLVKVKQLVGDNPLEIVTPAVYSQYSNFASAICGDPRQRNSLNRAQDLPFPPHNIAINFICTSIKSALMAEGDIPVTIGTINREESVIFGKVSLPIAYNDYEPLITSSKKDVYDFAHILGVPKTIIDSTPTLNIEYPSIYGCNTNIAVNDVVRAWSS
jgi:hypothetical protein